MNFQKCYRCTLFLGIKLDAKSMVVLRGFPLESCVIWVGNIFIPKKEVHSVELMFGPRTMGGSETFSFPLGGGELLVGELFWVESFIRYQKIQVNIEVSEKDFFSKTVVEVENGYFFLGDETSTHLAGHHFLVNHDGEEQKGYPPADCLPILYLEGGPSTYTLLAPLSWLCQGNPSYPPQSYPPQE